MMMMKLQAEIQPEKFFVVDTTGDAAFGRQKVKCFVIELFSNNSYKEIKRLWVLYYIFRDGNLGYRSAEMSKYKNFILSIIGLLRQNDRRNSLFVYGITIATLKAGQ